MVLLTISAIILVIVLLSVTKVLKIHNKLKTCLRISSSHLRGFEDSILTMKWWPAGTKVMVLGDTHRLAKEVSDLDAMTVTLTRETIIDLLKQDLDIHVTTEMGDRELTSILEDSLSLRGSKFITVTSSHPLTRLTTVAFDRFELGKYNKVPFQTAESLGLDLDADIVNLSLMDISGFEVLPKTFLWNILFEKN